MDDEPEIRVGICSAGNTLIPCLQTIVAKGYTVKHYFLNDTPGEWENPQWDAEKDGCIFSATSPEALLGLIAMWEVRGDDWSIKAGESELLDRLVDSAVMYDCEGNVIDQ